MQDTATYPCAYCGELNVTLPDWSAGRRQQYIEDCAVCCQPNVLRVCLNPDLDEVSVVVEPA
ncbi:MAG: CPXCG motif-containing cysteine-rich protein [Chloracidobacterium sp.]|uniref:CPXCG motif-containing cysteine-rich protein n=1 Tax=Chloracidobacterium validum TaxID=2821543 RepID=A0ABX8BC37_9BACT|nr:CPXCG motif-containing cysteine-rich protein [Chloracidobacterium validum]QUW03591.1 CPXCG motif-containing cysteine-rich protein [Chloracidobacterium validum]